MLSEGEAAPARIGAANADAGWAAPRVDHGRGSSSCSSPPPANTPSAHAAATVLAGRGVAGSSRRHDRRQCRAKVARDGAVRATRDTRADGVRRPDFLTEAPFEAAARL